MCPVRAGFGLQTEMYDHHRGEVIGTWGLAEVLLEHGYLVAVGEPLDLPFTMTVPLNTPISPGATRAGAAVTHWVALIGSWLAATANRWRRVHPGRS